jgi:molybdopterin/thiamine biosynthesis adenylyltransferase
MDVSRQCLCSENDINQIKGFVIAPRLQQINPHWKGKLYQETVMNEATCSSFDFPYYKSIHLICIGTNLDNRSQSAQIRKYLSAKSIQHHKILTSASTLGFKGNTDISIPHITDRYDHESYSQDITYPRKSSLPFLIGHTILWAKGIFTSVRFAVSIDPYFNALFSFLIAI